MVIVAYNRQANQYEAYHSLTDAEPFWTGDRIEAGSVRFELVPGGAVGICEGWISYSPAICLDDMRHKRHHNG